MSAETKRPAHDETWMISPLRKAKYRWLERGVERQLSGLMSRRYFLVALQVHIDAQVLVHSDFKSIPEFIADSADQGRIQNLSTRTNFN